MTTVAASGAMRGDYPVRLEVDPPAPQSRLSILLRILFLIPHVIVLAAVGFAVAIVTLIAWVVIVITGRYPAGMLQFSVGAQRWYNRFTGYAFLVTDKFPPFSLAPEADYPVRFIGDGQVEGRNRLTVFFRMILVIPHYIIVSVLGYAAGIIGVIAWVAGLITGSVPAGLHSFLAGYVRWNARYIAYLSSIVDEYPPFSLD